jgi:Tol biopolymer transport system component
VNLTANLSGLAVQAEAAIGGIDISPDDTELAFVAGAPGPPAAPYSTYVLPVPLGGTPRRRLEARQGMRWSPDGKRLAGVGIPGNQNGYIWIIEPLGPVPFRKLTDLRDDVYPRGASWARDESSIVIGLSQFSGDIMRADRSRRPVPSGGDGAPEGPCLDVPL